VFFELLMNYLAALTSF